MALIVEDGTLVVDAESYVDFAYVSAYASKRGLSLSTDETAVEPLIMKAMDKVESMEADFQGSRVSSSQSLSFPRYNVSINGFEIESTDIPKVLKDAVARLTYDASQVELMPTSNGKELKSKGTGPLRKEWFEKGTSTTEPELTAARALLEKLFASDSGDAFLSVCRG